MKPRVSAVLISSVLLAAVGCTTSGLTSGIPSGEVPSVTAEKLYLQLDQAFANHDANQILSFVDSGSYVSIDAKGKRQSYPEYRRTLEQNFARIRNQ